MTDVSGVKTDTRASVDGPAAHGEVVAGQRARGRLNLVERKNACMNGGRDARAAPGRAVILPAGRAGPWRGATVLDLPRRPLWILPSHVPFVPINMWCREFSNQASSKKDFSKLSPWLEPLQQQTKNLDTQTT